MVVEVLWGPVQRRHPGANLADGDGQTPLHQAAEGDDREVVKLKLAKMDRGRFRDNVNTAVLI